MKLFMWRALRGCLPTRCNLFRRGVDCTTTCPPCGLATENDWHVFFGCNKSIQCWTEAGVWEGLRDVLHAAADFNAAIFQVLGSTSTQQQADFIIIMWCLWRRRNDKLWQGEERTHAIVVSWARSNLSDWLNVRNRDHDEHQTAEIRNQQEFRWKRPAQGEFKCNIDAAIFNDQGMFGIGMCIRDGTGAFIRAKSLWMKGVPPAQEAEAIGLLEAIKWVRKLGFLLMSIELDCKPIVDGVLGNTIHNSEFGTILDDCKEALRQLTNYRISFIWMQANQVAHSLARASRNYASSQVFDLIPTCMLEHFTNDMS